MACAPLVAHLSTLAPTTIVLFALLVIGVAVWRLGWRRRRAWLGLRHFGSYPPLWVSAAWGLVAVLELERCSEWAILVLPVTAFAAWAVAAYATKGNPESAARTNPDVESPDAGRLRTIDELKTPEEIICWFGDDREVRTPSDDLFGHDAIAQRIARRLSVMSNEGRAPSIAVVGPLGSGKTTIGRLVEHHLRDSPHVELVSTSLWPFETPEAAVRGILDSLIRSLSEHVEIIGLRGLSEDYVRAVEGFGDRWGVFARFLGGPSRPKETLDRVSEIACAIGVRFVLWVEDLERFCGAGPGEVESCSIEDATRLGPIRALLHILGGCENLSVIVAGTSLDARFDLDKIARYVERIPELDPGQVARLFSVVRKHYLDGYPHKIIDPVGDEARQGFLRSPELGARWANELHRLMSHRVGDVDAVALLASTPRVLKSCLRLIHEIWRALAGEVDLDDVIAATVIRVTRPHVFSLLDRHVHHLRTDFMHGDLSERSTPEEHPAFLEIEGELKREPHERVAESLRLLIRRVFTGYPEGGGGGTAVEHLYLSRPQGLAVNRHADNWSRYLSLAAIPHDKSDQGALASILAWKDKKPSDLVERLIDDERGSQVGSFLCLFEGHEILRLLLEVTQAVARQPEPSYEWYGDVSGMGPVWGMAQQRSIDGGQLLRVVERITDEWLPRHLPLVQTVVRNFGCEDHDSIRSLLTPEQRKELARHLHEALVRTYPSGSGARLLVSLREGPPDTLLRLAWRPPGIRAGQTTGRPFDRWAHYAGVMLEAAELDPSVGLAQIIPFVTKTEYRIIHTKDQHVRQPVATFVEEAARELFEFDRLVGLLAKSEVPAKVPDELRAAWVAASQRAREIQQSNGCRHEEQPR